MSDELTGKGQAVGAPPVQKSDVSTTGSTPVGEQAEPYLGTFLTREDAEKGFEEVRKQRDKNTTRLKEIEEENRRLNEEVLKKLTEAVAAKEAPADPAADYAQGLERLQNGIRERIESGEDYSDLVLQTMQATADAMKKETSAARQRELQELQHELMQVKSQLKEYDPAWQKADKEKVKEVMELAGVDRDQAIKIVNRYSPSQPTQPETPRSPGSTVSGRVIDPDEAPKLKDHQLALIKEMYPKATQEQIEKVAKRLADRRKK